MAQVPTNATLWHMVVTQAKAKYATYPSPGASHWVHKRYVELGGKFEDTSETTRRKKLMAQQMEARRREHLSKSKKLKDKEKNEKGGKSKRGDKK